MLILTRKIGESLMLGPDIEVAVLGIKGKQVRIGVRAPEGVNVSRTVSARPTQRPAASAAAPD